MNNIETASLVLPTVCTTNINNINTQITWNNINLKNILGSMYDKYDKFNIELVSISQCTTADNFGTDDNDSNVLIQMSGLPFVNNNYSLLTGNNVNSTIIAFYNFYNYDETTTQNYLHNSRTFIKDTKYLVDITINYLRYDLTNVNSVLVNNLYGVPISGFYPEMVFMFNIYGIPNDKNNHNGSRMQIAN
jgi:hypothetical protein